MQREEYFFQAVLNRRLPSALKQDTKHTGGSDKIQRETDELV